MTNGIIVQMYTGLGDSIFQLPIIEALMKKYDEVYVDTPLPQFYRHLGSNIFFLPPTLLLRTQAKMNAKVPNEVWTQKIPDYFFDPVTHVPRPGFPLSHNDRHKILKPGSIIKLHYGTDTLNHGTYIQTFEKQAKVDLGKTFTFNMPNFRDTLKPLRLPKKRKLAVIRPAIDRAEWLAASRQCKPEYINEAAKQLKAAGYYVVSIADLKKGEEWISNDSAAPVCDVAYHHGELSIEQLLALHDVADVVVSGVGFPVCFAIGYKTNVFIIFGGRGEYDNISNITDFRHGVDNIKYAVPDHFCRCTSGTHNCDKTISEFSVKFANYLRSINATPRKNKT